MKDYEPGDITVCEFMEHVYLWLYEGRNKCVREYHYSCCKVMDEKTFRKEIISFLRQRMFQGEGINANTLPRWFISKAATKYINEL